MSVSTEAEPHSSMQPTSTSRWKLVALRAEGSGQRAVGAGNCGQARTREVRGRAALPARRSPRAHARRAHLLQSPSSANSGATSWPLSRTQVRGSDDEGKEVHRGRYAGRRGASGGQRGSGAGAVDMGAGSVGGACAHAARGSPHPRFVFRRGSETHPLFWAKMTCPTTRARADGRSVATGGACTRTLLRRAVAGPGSTRGRPGRLWCAFNRPGARGHLLVYRCARGAAERGRI